jgi:hypothetical protein
MSRNDATKPSRPRAKAAAKFGVGAQTRQQVEQAADARRAMSDATNPRIYSER